MNPVLKKMIEASGIRVNSELRVKHILLAALHWRGDELWCGPFEVGGIWSDDGALFEDGHYINKIEYLSSWGGKNLGPFADEHAARAALEAAARKQIKDWFEEHAK
jgi:hypothetical protein